MPGMLRREPRASCRARGSRCLLLDSELETLTKPLALDGVTVIRRMGAGGPEDSYRAVPGQRTAVAAAQLARRLGGDGLDQLHLRHHGQLHGVQYTYRGVYLNALGEVIHVGMSADSVHLWTLPMFHRNGCCIPWAVTAFAPATCPRALWAPISSGS